MNRLLKLIPLDLFQKVYAWQGVGFPFNSLPTPQSDEYLKFMKKHLVAGNPVIWMVMFNGDSYPDKAVQVGAGLIRKPLRF